MSISKKGGIYQIVNLINKKIYIGSSVNFSHRKSRHWGDFIRNRHGNPHLQNAVNKYGIENFIFQKLEYCEREFLIEREQFWVDTFRPQYNKKLVVNSGKGVPKTQAFKDWTRICHSDRLRELSKINAEKNKKPVLVYNSNGNFIGIYNSTLQASEKLNIPYYLIRANATKKTEICKKGLRFFYKTSEDYPLKIEKFIRTRQSNFKTVDVYKNEVYIGRFESLLKASKSLNIHHSIVYRIYEKKCKQRFPEHQGYKIIDVYNKIK